MKKTLLNQLKTEHAALCAVPLPEAETQSKIKILETKIEEIENPKTEKPQPKK